MSTGSAGTPLGGDDFAALMDALRPFETRPHVAVAVSGGGDSMALCLLALEWAQRRQGRVSALTVDHGLRPEAAAEARQVGHWLETRGSDHCILRWDGIKPVSGVQAAARDARYRLMTAWCRDAGVLHLLLAHNLEDQAETFLMRLQRGSGAAGLAAMAAVVETPSVRLLRPLLGTARDRLRATLRARRQEWIEDPSNDDPGFARIRLRRAFPALAGAGISAAGLAAAARRLAEVRVVIEDAVSALLAGCCTVHAAGYAEVDGGTLAAAPHEVSLQALERLLIGIGGKAYAPRRERLARLHRGLAAGRPATLGGCRIVPLHGRLLVCREGRHAPAPIPVAAGDSVTWDGRFFVRLAGNPGDGASLAPLGRDGWRDVIAQRPDLRGHTIPAAVRPSLPALRDADGITAVWHLGFEREGAHVRFAEVAFRPLNSISGSGFSLA